MWVCQKAISIAVRVDIESDNLAEVVDPVESCAGRSIWIERGGLAGVAIENYAVLNSVDDVEPDRDAEIVYSEKLGLARTGRIDCREVALVIQETVNGAP